MTTTEWGDFDLHVEFKAPASTNSGIFLRSVLEPTDPTKDCYELNIAPPDNPYPTGSLVGLQKIAYKSTADEAAREWHTFDVTATRGNLIMRLDGKVDIYRHPAILRGHFGLQSKQGNVEFRNIRLRPISVPPRWNMRDFSGWTTVGAEQIKYEVTKSGELHITNGPGQIATEEQFQDFVLRLECKVNGDGLNSGVFFRALPTGRWMGYESQINNRYLNGDRTKPADFGTGGIYRRQPARRVVADDHEWFTMTINAAGSHFAVWVNGYQVSDWTDTRPAAENPREGLQLGPGVIAIQGHDPTTDFLFRDVRIGELPRSGPP